MQWICIYPKTGETNRIDKKHHQHQKHDWFFVLISWHFLFDLKFLSLEILQAKVVTRAVTVWKILRYFINAFQKIFWLILFFYYLLSTIEIWSRSELFVKTNWLWGEVVLGMKTSTELWLCLLEMIWASVISEVDILSLCLQHKFN